MTNTAKYKLTFEDGKEVFVNNIPEEFERIIIIPFNIGNLFLNGKYVGIYQVIEWIIKVKLW